MNIINCISDNKNISRSAKLLFNEIVHLARKKGYCFANNNFFAEKYNVTKRTVQLWLEQLKKEGLIKINITFKENMKWVEERHISLTEKTKNLLNFKDNKTNLNKSTGEKEKSDKIQIEEPLKQQFIEVLNTHFDNKINDKEVFDILKALELKKVDNAEYLKEKIAVLENARNIKSPIGFLIKAIMENIQPSNVKPKEDKGLNVHTRHHEIHQSYREYTEEQLEDMLRTNKKHRTKEDIERINEIAKKEELKVKEEVEEIETINVKIKGVDLEAVKGKLPNEYEILKKGKEHWDTLNLGEQIDIKINLQFAGLLDEGVDEIIFE